MTSNRLRRYQRIEAVLRMQEQIALLERSESEKRMSSIDKNKDLLAKGEQSIFSRMAEGMYAGIATYSIVDAYDQELKIKHDLQSELRKLRGTRKALERLTQDDANKVLQARNEEALHENGGRSAYVKKP